RFRMFKISHFFAALLLVIIGVSGTAQAQLVPRLKPQPPAGPVPTAVVLDFSVSPRVKEWRDCCTREINYKARDVVTEKDSRGWWLGRQDIYVNANVGRMAADILTDELREQCVYQVRSRGDLKIYYADKR